MTTPTTTTPINLPDPGGLICGFVLRGGDAPAEPLRAPPDPAACGADGRLVWLHFNLGDTRARNWVVACDRIPPAARDVLVGGDLHVRLARAGDGLAGVVGDLHYDFDADPDSLGVLRLYVDAACVVTCRRTPLKVVDRVRREVLAGLPVETPMHLVAHLLGGVADTLDAVVGDLGDTIDDVEDRVLTGRPRDDRGALGRARRLMARLRRHLSAERHALALVLPRLPAWCADADAARLRDAHDRLGGVAQDLDLVQDRARLLQEEIASRLNEATGRNLYFLSIITAIFLPVTLVTGVFGMNVGGLPWVERGYGFAAVLVVMAATVGLTLLVLHWKRFF